MKRKRPPENFAPKRVVDIFCIYIDGKYSLNPIGKQVHQYQLNSQTGTQLNSVPVSAKNQRKKHSGRQQINLQKPLTVHRAGKLSLAIKRFNRNFTYVNYYSL